MVPEFSEGVRDQQLGQALREVTERKVAAGFTREQVFEVSVEIWNLIPEPRGREKVGELELTPVPAKRHQQAGGIVSTFQGYGAEAGFFLYVPHWSDAVDSAQFHLVKPTVEALTLAQSKQPVVANFLFRGENYEFHATGFQRIGSLDRVRPRVKPELIFEFSRQLLAGIGPGPSPRLIHPLMQALWWMNEPLVASTATLESRFLMTWFAFQTILNHMDPTSPAPPFDSSEWPVLKKNFGDWLDALNYPVEKRGLADSRLSELNRPSSLERQLRFSEKHKLEVGAEEFQRINRARNDIVHAPWKLIEGLREINQSLDRLSFRALSVGAGLDPTRYEVR